MNVIEKVFGTHSERELKRILPIVDKIESLRDDMMALTDEQLKDKTKEYKTRLAQGETLDDLLPEAYATVREADTEHSCDLLKGSRKGSKDTAEVKKGFRSFFAGHKAGNHILRICEKTVTTCCQRGVRLAFSGLIC